MADLRQGGTTALVDSTGVVHRPARHPRIVSLVPSITELLFDLGLAARIVGRTGFCIHPEPAVRELTKVGGTKKVKLDVLQALAPTHVIVNIDENDAGDVEALRTFVPHVVVTHPNAPEDNLELYALLGALFGAEEAAAALSARLESELERCRAMVWPVETVLYLIWKAPWMTIASDTYIARTLAVVGWRVTTAAGGWAGCARYPQIDDLAAASREVQRVLLSSEPYPFTTAEATALASELAPVAVQWIDAEMTSWYGSRAIRGLAYLRELRSATVAGKVE